MGIQYKDVIEKSAAVIMQYQQDSGAYAASPYFSHYQYTWFRDGAFTADAMSRAGYVESAERFFDWCTRVIVDRRDAIYSGHYLNARYTYDGSDPTGDWAAVQIDGYGVVLWALQQHTQRHSRSIEKYQDLIDILQWYLMEHWRESSYDWWEERLGKHAVTFACVYAGLKAFNNPIAEQVRAEIHTSEERTDASMLACVLFDAVDKEQAENTIHRVESELVSTTGGVYRYKDDSYYGGGEWPILTALLGLCYAKLGRIDDAQRTLKWCMEATQSNGWVPEQQAKHLLFPDMYAHWVERWGQPANPLLWSQAMSILLADEIHHKSVY